MKLWAKQTHEQTAATLDLTSLASLVEEFTVGRDRELDAHMAAFDVLGSLAHTQMLTSIGLMQPDELREVQRELRALYAQVERGEFVIEPGIEDVHSQVELVLTRLLGDVGKKIHSGRSRNDQVLVDVKLFVRSEIRSIVLAAERLFERLRWNTKTCCCRATHICKSPCRRRSGCGSAATPKVSRTT
jgi:argininosuccinate lyase